MGTSSDQYGGRLDTAIESLVSAGDGVEWRSADGQVVRFVDTVRIHGKRVRWKPSRDGAEYVCPFRSFGLWIMVNDATPRTES